jgi:hypothetical protein
MAETPNRDEQILAMIDKFIAVANQLKEEGNDIEIVNASLMLASGTFATYLSAGNEGYLKEDGIRKISEGYKHNLTLLQDIKKAQLNPDGKD